MKISKVEQGKYVVAVSGGVDSVVLLDLLSRRDDLELVVAHFDHGIRQDSSTDAKFVEKLAKNYGLKFVSAVGDLGPEASEATAREKRYAFLTHALDKTKAKGIITAHHQDDMIETAIINMLRGTKRRGLSSLKTGTTLIRPLLGVPKVDIIDYAKTNDLKWREDESNQDTKYLRNYIRKEILKPLNSAKRLQFLEKIESANEKNKQIDEMLQNLAKDRIKKTAGELRIDRGWYITLPAEVRLEILNDAIRSLRGAGELDSKQLTYLDMIARTASHGTVHDISAKMFMSIIPLKVLVNTKTL